MYPSAKLLFIRWPVPLRLSLVRTADRQEIADFLSQSAISSRSVVLSPGQPDTDSATDARIIDLICVILSTKPVFVGTNFQKICIGQQDVEVELARI
jgi:hypothetical protein